MLIRPPASPAFWWPLGLGLLAGYLIGSIPFGLILARLAGAGDVRRIGSGNIGATNVLRTGRKGLALATLVLDLAKGFVPAWLAFAWLGPDVAVVTALGCVLGHCFPIWLRFRGGKGVATAAGVVLALSPGIGLALIAIFALMLALSRYVSLGSMIAALAAPPLAFVLGHAQLAELYLLVALVIVVKHAGNIRRLLAGSENRFTLPGRR